jgi:hypothetical protein
MKQILLTLTALLMVFSMSGCMSSGVSVHTAKEYKGEPDVVKIVTVDGITLYRINDGGEFVYFSGQGTQYSTISGRIVIKHQVPNCKKIKSPK